MMLFFRRRALFVRSGVRRVRLLRRPGIVFSPLIRFVRRRPPVRLVSCIAPRPIFLIPLVVTSVSRVAGVTVSRVAVTSVSRVAEVAVSRVAITSVSRVVGIAASRVAVISVSRVAGISASRVVGIRWRKRPESLIGTAPIASRSRSMRFPGRHRWCMVLAAGRPRRHRGVAAEIPRPGGCRYSRAPMVLCSEVLTVPGGRVFMLHLRLQSCPVWLARVCLFLPSCPCLHSAGPAVEGNMILMHDHRPVVDAGHIRDADVRDRTVVVELASAPLTAGKSDTGISEPIVNAPIEADVRSPVAGVPHIQPAAPAPVSRRPQHSDRSHYPRARHPVVTVVIVPPPITRRPHISRAGTDGLRIDWKRRWTDTYRNPNCNLSKRCSGK